MHVVRTYEFQQYNHIQQWMYKPLRRGSIESELTVKIQHSQIETQICQAEIGMQTIRENHTYVKNTKFIVNSMRNRKSNGKPPSCVCFTLVSCIALQRDVIVRTYFLQQFIVRHQSSTSSNKVRTTLATYVRTSALHTLRRPPRGRVQQVKAPASPHQQSRLQFDELGGQSQVRYG